MEKRWSERKSLQVDVDVYQQGRLLGSCVSADIGLGGTFLTKDCTFPLPGKDSGIELVFSLATAGQNTKHKINARVARVSETGFGLKFCDFDTGVFRALQEIMSYQQHATAENGDNSLGSH